MQEPLAAVVFADPCCVPPVSSATSSAILDAPCAPSAPCVSQPGALSAWGEGEGEGEGAVPAEHRAALEAFLQAQRSGAHHTASEQRAHAQGLAHGPTLLPPADTAAAAQAEDAGALGAWGTREAAEARAQ